MSIHYPRQYKPQKVTHGLKKMHCGDFPECKQHTERPCPDCKRQGIPTRANIQKEEA